MNILQLLASSNFIVLNKNLINAIGLEEALLLGELCSEYDYWLKNEKSNDGWFFSTVENVEKNTTLNDYKQRKAINNLINMKIIEMETKGLPAKRYFKINEEQVIEILNIKYSNNLRTSSLNFKELDVKNLKTNNNKDNNNKNNNKYNKEEKETFISIINKYSNNEELKETIRNYVDMRNKMKGFTTNALKLNLNKLSKMANDDETKIAVINQSIMNSWKGFYELKQSRTITKPNYSEKVEDLTKDQEDYLKRWMKEH